jgi:hypothetical protein
LFLKLPAASIWNSSPTFQRPSLPLSSGNDVMGNICLLFMYIVYAPCTALDQTCGTMRNAYKILSRISMGKRRLKRPRRRLEDDIKMNLIHEECWDIDWIQLAQDSPQ